jgi:hypothetical protein
MVYYYNSIFINENSSIQNWVISYVIQCCGIWPIIAYKSENLLLDGVLFDIIMICVFYVVMVIHGECSGFNTLQIAGGSLALVGIIMVKIGELSI